MKTIELLVKFVNQKPGLEFCNYGDYKLYRQEMNEITRDKHDFNELLTLAYRRIEKLDQAVHNKLLNSGDRLSLVDGQLQYITGQYFPTEYRPAACRCLASLIWEDYRNEKDSQGNPVYKDGYELRKAIARNVSRRVKNNYFN